MPEPHDLDEWLITGEDELPEPATPAATPKVPRRPGRPSKQTAAVIAKICEFVAEGMPVTYACRAAGVSNSSLLRWKSGPRGKAITDALERADALFVAHHLGVIRKASASGQWTASAWLLERTHQEFARRVQTDTRIDKRVVSVEITPEELAAYSRRVEQLVPDPRARSELAVEILRLAAPKGDL
jgi:hypothetical protein